MADQVVTGSFGGIKYHDNGDGTYSETQYVVGNSTGSSTTSTVVQVASSASNVTLAVANSSRTKIIVSNDSTQALYVKYGVSASLTSYTVLLGPGDVLTEDAYDGRIDGIWASANGNAYVTEM